MEYTYACKKCGKQFTTCDGVYAQKREKPEYCPYCGEKLAFNRSVSDTVESLLRQCSLLTKELNFLCDKQEDLEQEYWNKRALLKSHIQEYGISLDGKDIPEPKKFSYDPKSSAQSLKSLGISSQSYCLLMCAGITTIQKLMAYSEEELYRICGVNTECLKDIYNKLVENGYSPHFWIERERKKIDG